MCRTRCTFVGAEQSGYSGPQTASHARHPGTSGFYPSFRQGTDLEYNYKNLLYL